MDGLLQYLQAGGDVGIWVAVAGLWRLDRRLFALEIMQGKN
tara:strand:+ start:1445 stop:1567 length:123 start_codon:yes stop_codon:yes gene_type:complete